MPENNSKIENEIRWLDGDIPLSSLFDDPYYSKADGLLETDHVFIHGNKLPDRWPGMKTCTIAELGFGTGLNFLATVSAWMKQAQPDQKLHFISFEQYPMTPAEMRQALAQWPALKDDAEKLANSWEAALKAQLPMIEINWSSQIDLTIHLGDANKTLTKQNLLVDAWYLDGFSPAKNPELWNEHLMQTVFNKTRDGGTFATYTAAGWVRRNLSAAGFEVKRIPGHAGKRQMSIGAK